MAADTYAEITALTALDTTDGSADYITVADASAGSSKKSTRNVYLGLASAPLGTTDTQSPTNKTFDNTNIFTIRDDRLTLQDSADTTKQAVFQLSGITTGTTRTYTLPNATGTLADIASAQTFTNKTLTSPTINSATIANPTLTVDSIAEYTSANGVSVDGLLTKDGTVGPGTITPAGLVTGSGSTWVWQSYTPTFTNLSVGNGTLVAKYSQIGKLIIIRLNLVFGSTTSITGDVTFSLPIASVSYAGSANLTPLGLTGMYDTNVGRNYIGHVAWSTTTTAKLVANAADTAYLYGFVLSSTVPMTWATGDEITTQFIYEAA